MKVETERRILVIDDNHQIHTDFRKLLARPGATALDAMESELFGSTVQELPDVPVYEVESALQGEEGVHRVARAIEDGRPFAVAFVDMRMPPGWDGMTTIEHIIAIDDAIQIVICTAYSEYSWEDVLRRFPGSDRILILKKPFDTAEVCQLAAALTMKWHLAKHAHLKRSQLEAMVREQTSELQRTNQELRLEVVQRVTTERALRDSQTRFALAAAGARDGVWDWDLLSDRLYCSPRWMAMVGLPEESMEGSPSVWFDRVLSEDRPAFDLALADHVGGRTNYLQCEYRIQHADGHPRWMLCRGMATRSDSGGAVRIAGSQTDITDRKLAEEQLRRLALHDALTGLPNRVLLRDRLERCLAQRQRDPEFRYAVLYMDLDRFKVVNDTLGHEAGDELLCRFGERVSRMSRSVDTLTRVVEDPMARIGGDEFVMLLEGLKEDFDALRVAERVIEAASEPFDIGGRSLEIGCSIGIALGADGYKTSEEVLRDADLALYHAKSKGRRRYEVFDRGVHDATLLRWQLEGEMRADLGTGAFRVQYQPIISLETGEVTSVEALVRWDHQRLGRMPPAEFIPLAEETGLIVPIGLEVLRRACRDLKRWRTEHSHLRHVRLAINVSPRQVERGDLATTFAAIVREEGVDAQDIDLEITESVLMDCSAGRLIELQRLRALGFRLHLDDFGTGYCSLSYLRSVCVDALKIDLSFTQSLDKDPLTEPIVRAMLTLAQNFKAVVIAEGIETETQRERMRALGCDQGQGYLFLRPTDAELVPELTRAMRRMAS